MFLIDIGNRDALESKIKIALHKIHLRLTRSGIEESDVSTIIEGLSDYTRHIIDCFQDETFNFDPDDDRMLS